MQAKNYIKNKCVILMAKRHSILLTGQNVFSVTFCIFFIN